jgi:hypothetical protein
MRELSKSKEEVYEATVRSRGKSESASLRSCQDSSADLTDDLSQVPTFGNPISKSGVYPHSSALNATPRSKSSTPDSPVLSSDWSFSKASPIRTLISHFHSHVNPSASAPHASELHPGPRSGRHFRASLPHPRPHAAQARGSSKSPDLHLSANSYPTVLYREEDVLLANRAVGGRASNRVPHVRLHRVPDGAHTSHRYRLHHLQPDVRHPLSSFLREAKRPLSPCFFPAARRCGLTTYVPSLSPFPCFSS